MSDPHDPGVAPPTEAPAPVPAAPQTDPPWRSLHPASVAVNLVPRTWRVISSLWPIALAIVFGGGGGSMAAWGLWELAGLSVLLGGGAVSTVVHFLTLRFRVREDGNLEIRQGLLNREARVISPERIQNVELVRNVFHSLVGLVEVRLETAGAARTEGMLSALTEADARALMEALAAARGRVLKDPEAEAAVAPMLQVEPKQLVLYGLTRGSAGLVGVLVFGVFEYAGDDIEGLTELGAAAGVATVVAVVLGAVVLSWIGSAGLALVRHWKHRIVQEEDGLRAEEGLFTRRRVEIPYAKVQIVKADEPLVRRWLGYGTVSVETAGLGAVRDGVSAAEAMVPMVAHDRLGELFRAAIPRARVDPWTEALRPPHPRVLRRLVVGSLIRLGVLVGVVLGLAPWPGSLAVLLLVPLGLLGAWLDFRHQGWTVTDTSVVARRGFWRRRTWLLARDKVQSLELMQGPLMRWHGLGRLVVSVAGSRVALPDLGYADAERLMEALGPAGKAA